MGKLVIILVFTLGALLMLQSVAGDGCRSYGVKGYVYIIQMGGIRMMGSLPFGKHGQWFKVGASVDPAKRLQVLQTGNPYYLKGVAKYLVSDCKKAEEDIQKDSNLNFGSGGGGKEWYLAQSPKDVDLLFNIVEKHAKSYQIHKKENEAEVEEGDNDMTDSGNSRRRLQKLLTYLLN